MLVLKQMFNFYKSSVKVLKSNTQEVCQKYKVENPVVELDG
jgi:hypothetical protein